MHRCCVCNRTTYNFKTCMPSERMLPVCEECAAEAPLDTLDGFSEFCAERIFKGDNMESLLIRYKNVKNSIISFFHIDEEQLQNAINQNLNSKIKENITANKYFEPLFHMSDIPGIEYQKGELNPLIYKIYKSPINSSYWCASGYDRRIMTFSGLVLGLDLSGTSFTIDELYAYMAIEHKDIKLPMRLSDVKDLLSGV